jgi:uncharacterized surface protein with fasciclin (FAS1) repeats
MTRWFIATLAAAVILPAAIDKLAAAESVQKDIVETAVAAEFTTFVKAVQAAGLVETLKGKGPFTVFAPTDKAFTAVPKAKLDALLQDKKALTAVLTYHVVQGKVTAADVARVHSAKTIQGQNLRITVKDSKVRVSDANVVQADILCSNGMIHVVDAVLLPDIARAAAVEIIDETLGKSGAPADTDTSAAELKSAAERVLKLVPSNVLVREMLTGAMIGSRSPGAAKSLARGLQDPLRGAGEILRFEPTVEAQSPAGFPEPTPVGEIEIKTYPPYRLARTEITGSSSNGGAFWKLFQHITRNEIAMTAPVEMTYRNAPDNRGRPEAMAFLYESQAVGKIGRQDEVQVADVPAITVVSMGMRGDHSDDAVKHAQSLLQNWLHEHQDRYGANGSLRVLGFNSPMVPVSDRYFEVQIPLREKRL